MNRNRCSRDCREDLIAILFTACDSTRFKSELYSTSFRRTTTVMGQRRNVDNLGYFDTCAMHGADCRFTTVSGAFYICLYFSQAKVKGNFCTILSSHLGGIGSVFLRSSEAHFPADDHEITCPSALARATMMLLNEECTCSWPMASTLTFLFLAATVFLPYLFII